MVDECGWNRDRRLACGVTADPERGFGQAGGLPVVLWCLVVIGMLWADVSWDDRFAGLASFHRLLAIPLLLTQFRHSENGIWVILGFFISAITVLLASYIGLVPGYSGYYPNYGVPVHDTIFQGSLFLICGFG